MLEAQGQGSQASPFSRWWKAADTRTRFSASSLASSGCLIAVLAGDV